MIPYYRATVLGPTSTDVHVAPPNTSHLREWLKSHSPRNSKSSHATKRDCPIRVRANCTRISNAASSTVPFTFAHNKTQLQRMALEPFSKEPNPADWVPMRPSAGVQFGFAHNKTQLQRIALESFSKEPNPADWGPKQPRGALPNRKQGSSPGNPLRGFPQATHTSDTASCQTTDRFSLQATRHRPASSAISVDLQDLTLRTSSDPCGWARMRSSCRNVLVL